MLTYIQLKYFVEFNFMYSNKTGEIRGKRLKLITTLKKKADLAKPFDFLFGNKKAKRLQKGHYFPH